jgi:hypothetical protein
MNITHNKKTAMMCSVKCDLWGMPLVQENQCQLKQPEIKRHDDDSNNLIP